MRAARNRLFLWRRLLHGFGTACFNGVDYDRQTTYRILARRRRVSLDEVASVEDIL
jgi:hypothetical protein